MLALERAFPDYQHAPATTNEVFSVTRIVGLVRRDLCFPELAVRARPAEARTVMAMPEASIHENASAIATQNKVRPSRKSGNVKAIPKAVRKQRCPYELLRLRIGAANPRHAQAALRRRENVSHASARWTATS